MNKKLVLFYASGVALASSQLLATTWQYDFGTGTGTFSTASTVSTTFLPTPPSGTTYARIGSAGGSLALLNSGITGLGSGTELRLTAPTSTSVNKWAINNYSPGSTSYSMTYSQVIGGHSGVFYFFTGAGSSFTSAGTFTGSETFTGLRYTLGGTAGTPTLAVDRRSGGSWVALTGSGISPATAAGVSAGTATDIAQISIYGNNSAAASTYRHGGTTYSLPANTWAMFVGDTQVGSNFSAALLASGSNINAFSFVGESSGSNVGTLTTDGFTYRNELTGHIWDSNGATAGSSNAGGNWSESKWTTAVDGDIATRAWADGDTPTFAGGTNGTGTYSVVVDTAVSAKGIAVEEGNVTIGAGAGTLTLSAGTVSVASGGSLSVSEPVLGSAGLTKSGSGSLSLSGTHGYSGATTVSEGTLSLATGSITSNVTVASGATLIANGDITGNVTVNGSMSGDALVTGTVTVNGSLSPGNSPGSMLVGNLALANGSTTTMEIAADDSHDFIDVDSVITYDGTLTIPVAGTHTAGETFNLFDFDSITPASTFDAVNVTGGLYSGSLVSNGSGTWSALLGGLTFTFTSSDGILSLSTAAIPEPLTAAGVLLLSARVMGRRSRVLV